ncbi:MAG TPA: DedA family protein [Candidatus Paceibacterota bacterium]|nr:DedA family protein [Candidatus Paceibacterota bacterium]
MEPFLSPLLSFVLLYKYVSIALIVYTSAVILPLPTNAMLLAVGAFASHGYFNYWIVLPLAVIANCLGDLTDYGITRLWGTRVIRVLRLNKIKFFNQLAEELRTDAAVTVFTTRFAGNLSPIAALLAGLVEVPLGTFLFYDFLGNVIEPGAALTIGYAVGDYWNDFSNILSLIAGIVAASIVIFILARIYRRIMIRYEYGAGGPVRDMLMEGYD